MTFPDCFATLIWFVIPSGKKLSSVPGQYNRWITISLVFVLVLAIAFVAWAVRRSRQQPPAKVATVVAETTATAPPPQPLTYNCPLDGSQTTDRSATMNRPLVIQIDNAPAARPQSGLSQADFVYEEMAEGQITRYNAVFACHEAGTVGPVRSARLIDLELTPEYQALLVDSGSSQGTTARLNAASADVPNMTDSTLSDAFHRVSDRYAPHNLMTGTAALRKAAAAAGLSVQVELTGPQFKGDSPPAQAAITKISVPYSPWADVSFSYDPGSNSWLRSVDGEPQKDAAKGKQLSPKNVIIQYVQVTTSDIVEDASGERGLDFTMTGSGRVLIFRDGQVISGQWQRPSKHDITTYVDASGRPIPLDVGQTWVEVVPTDFQASWG